jgi:hypothetical protein
VVQVYAEPPCLVVERPAWFEEARDAFVLEGVVGGR